MAGFSRFLELPKELRLQIWEAAIPRSPAVHFLSYPPKDHHAPGVYQWQRELVNPNRTINTHKDPDTGEPTTRTCTWGRYSSYLARLALLHACQESRLACLAHTASNSSHKSDASNIVSTKHYTLNLDTDIICIQDPDPRFPWNEPRCIILSPTLDPLRIALERRAYLDCFNNQYLSAWVSDLAGGEDAMYGCGTSLGHGDGELRLKMIYLLDYDIKAKYTILSGPSDMSDGGMKSSGAPETESVCPAVELPEHTSTHNGRFDGHGVTFYALSANKKKSSVGWDIPQAAWDFYNSIFGHVFHRYGFEVVGSLEETKKHDSCICIEFLACVKA